MGSKVYLSYDSESNEDGTGAQLARILGLYGVSQEYGLGYIHSPISNLLSHPLDPFQNDVQKAKYLERLNQLFALKSSPPLSSPKYIKKSSLTRRFLLLQILLSKILHQPRLILVSSPFQITNSKPDIFRFVPEVITSLREPKNRAELFNIVVHLRKIQGNIIVTGENSPRSLPNSYYLDNIAKIISSLPKDAIHSITIHTDVPESSTDYEVLTSDREHYLKAGHNFHNGTIKVESENLEDYFKIFGNRLQIIYGGDPILALKDMANADYLVLSRSALGFVGAILNEQGKIIYPTGFPLSPLSKWVPGI
jgi:hypothetical protein